MKKFRFFVKKKFVSRGDPNGSYTGSNINDNDLPEQDADDL